MIFRPGGHRTLPTVIKNLFIINVLVFVAELTYGQKLPLVDWFGLHSWQSPYFQPWQFITSMFMHGSWQHLFANMLALLMFGADLEAFWGPKRFITFYVASGLGSALCHMIVLFFENQAVLQAYHHLLTVPEAEKYDAVMQFIQQFGMGGRGTVEQIVGMWVNQSTIGASGAIFGCIAGFGFLYANVEPFPGLPIKGKWIALGSIGTEMYIVSTYGTNAGDGVAHFAHLGGALTGFLLVYFWNKTNRRPNN